MRVERILPLDELLATFQFIRRRVKVGQNWLRVLPVGGTDEMPNIRNITPLADEFEWSPRAVFRDIISSGVRLPWNLALSTLIGISPLFTGLTLGAEGGRANAGHMTARSS